MFAYSCYLQIERLFNIASHISILMFIHFNLTYIISFHSSININSIISENSYKLKFLYIIIIYEIVNIEY